MRPDFQNPSPAARKLFTRIVQEFENIRQSAFSCSIPGGRFIWETRGASSRITRFKSRRTAGSQFRIAAFQIFDTPQDAEFQGIARPPDSPAIRNALKPQRIRTLLSRSAINAACFFSKSMANPRFFC
jgi:hypothetical protein